MTTVVVVDVAEAQLQESISWWETNRSSAPGLVLEEFERCVTLLEHSPDVGLGFHRSTVPGVRRLLMKRTRHFVYYLHDVEHAVVYILAVWGAPKDGDPVLSDPR